MRVSVGTNSIHARWGLVGALLGLLTAISPLGGLAVIGLAGLLLVSWYEPTITLIVMLLIAPLKTLFETEVGVVLPLDFGQLAFVLVTAIWLLHAAIRGALWHGGQSMAVVWSVVAFLFITLFTIPTAVAPTAAINEWLKWAAIVLLIYILSDTTIIRWQWVVLGAVLAGVVQAVIGLYEFQGGSGAPHLWILDYQYFRAFGTFGQPNPFGAFLGLLLPLSIGTAWGYLQHGHTIRDHQTLLVGVIYIFFATLMLAGLLASWSRGAWLGFGAAAVVMVWCLPKNRLHGTLLVIFGAVILGLLTISGRIPPQLYNRVTDFSKDFTGFQDVRGIAINDDNYAVIERLAHWQAALDMAADAPITGVGFGNYEAAYADYALVNWPDALGHAHNYYLNLLAETGIPGLTVYVIMWGSIFRLTLITLRRTTGVQRGVVLGLLGTWTHLSIHSLVDKLYVNNMFLHIGVLFGILSVMCMQTHVPKNKRETIH